MTILRRVAECCAAVLPLLITTADRAPGAAPLTIVAVLQELGIELIEQPFRADDLDAAR